jgi:hypothetical protein
MPCLSFRWCRSDGCSAVRFSAGLQTGSVAAAIGPIFAERFGKTLGAQTVDALQAEIQRVHDIVLRYTAGIGITCSLSQASLLTALT